MRVVRGVTVPVPDRPDNDFSSDPTRDSEEQRNCYAARRAKFVARSEEQRRDLERGMARVYATCPDFDDYRLRVKQLQSAFVQGLIDPVPYILGLVAIARAERAAGPGSPEAA